MNNIMFIRLGANIFNAKNVRNIHKKGKNEIVICYNIQSETNPYPDTVHTYGSEQSRDAAFDEVCQSLAQIGLG